MELEHFSERMQRILLMSPLYRLDRRRFKDVHGQERSGMELGLMTLLFFFEQMLDGKKIRSTPGAVISSISRAGPNCSARTVKQQKAAPKACTAVILSGRHRS